MTTLQDIADRAGTSSSTVSRVLSGVKTTIPISESTRQRVLELADELEYYPNVAARALSSRRAGAIGLVIPAGAAERGYQRFFGLKLHEVLAGIELVANEAGLNLILQVATRCFFDDHGLARMYHGRLVDAVVLYEVALIPEEIPADLPAVFLNARNGSANESYVVADDHGGARQAVDYLVNLGHTQIGFIAGPDDHYVSHERRRGYEAAMAAHGLTATVVDGDLSEEGGTRAARTLLSGDGAPTAIFAAGDYMAIGALAATREMGLLVPDQISIIGADGMHVAAYTMPPITTVVTALYSMSRLAAGWAVKLVNRETSGPVHEVFPTELEERESCGPGASN